MYKTPPRKRARTALIDDQNAAHLTTTKHGRISEHQADKEVQVGPRFHQHYKDKRPKLNRILEPSMQWHMTHNDTAVTLNTGPSSQAVYQYELYSGNDVKNMMAAISESTNAYQSDGARGPAIGLTGEGGLNNTALTPIPNPTNVLDGTVLIGQSENAQILNGATTPYINSRIKLPIWQYRLHLRNAANMTARVTIYEYAAKGVYTNLSPTTAWDRMYITQNEQANDPQRVTFIGDLTTNATIASNYPPNATANTIDRTTIGERPYGPTLKRCFKKLNYTTYDMEPGRSLEYVVNNYRKSCTPDEITEITNQLAGAATNATWSLPGWTKYVLIIVQGIKCGNAAATANIGYSSCNINVLVEQAGMGWGKYNISTQRLQAWGGSIVPPNATSIWPTVSTGNQRMVNEESDLPVLGFTPGTN